MTIFIKVDLNLENSAIQATSTFQDQRLEKILQDSSLLKKLRLSFLLFHACQNESTHAFEVISRIILKYKSTKTFIVDKVKEWQLDLSDREKLVLSNAVTVINFLANRICSFPELNAKDEYKELCQILEIDGAIKRSLEKEMAYNCKGLRPYKAPEV